MFKFTTLIALFFFTETIFAQQVKVDLTTNLYGNYITPTVVKKDYSKFNYKKKSKRAIHQAIRKCNLNNSSETLGCLFWSYIEDIDDEYFQDVEQLFFKSKEDFYNRIVVSAGKSTNFSSICDFSIYDCSNKKNEWIAGKVNGRWDQQYGSIYSNTLNYIVQLSPTHVFLYYGERGNVFYCVVGDDVQVVYNEKKPEKMRHFSVIKDTIIRDSAKITFDDMPKELIDNFDKMGNDDTALLNDYEAEYLNVIFKDCRGDFDFKGKRIRFFPCSKVDFFKGEKNRHAEGVFPSQCKSFRIKLEDGKYYDAELSLVFWKQYCTQRN